MSLSLSASVSLVTWYSWSPRVLLYTVVGTGTGRKTQLLLMLLLKNNENEMIFLIIVIYMALNFISGQHLIRGNCQVTLVFWTICFAFILWKNGWIGRITVS